MKLSELKDKRILILGFGREGQDTFLFLKKIFPNKKIGIADRNDKISKKRFSGAEWFLGKDHLKSLDKYDLIIKSPGVPIHIPAIEKAFKEKKITSQTEIFLSNCPGKVIGITGTKGKSTTTSLIYNILKKGGIKANLVGNIGEPVLSYLIKSKKEDVFVFEMSCHQLYNLKISPHVSVFLNLYQEHLDYYKNIREYALAKANITLYQNENDYLIFNSKDKIVNKLVKKSKAKKIPIKGEYYGLDKNAARAVGKIFKIPNNIIEKTINNFKPLPHRLELVGTYKGITFYNDALATIPEATMAAMDFLGRGVETVMLGGFDRNIDFKNLAKKVLKNKIKTVILFPTTGIKIWKEIVRAGGGATPKHFFADNMKEAVSLAYKNTGTGKICLLSTAASSFSIFKNYEEKGNLFKKYVKLNKKNG